MTAIWVSNCEDSARVWTLTGLPQTPSRILKEARSVYQRLSRVDSRFEAQHIELQQEIEARGAVL